MKPKGWRGESRRHGLSAKGIKTAQKIPRIVKPDLMYHTSKLIDSFIEDVDYKNEKKEFSYDEVDGKIQKQQGGKYNAVFGTVVDEFMANEIRTIHNHPLEYPPSDQDIFTFLYSGRHKEDSVILPSGLIYTMKRKQDTGNLTMIGRNITKEESQRNGVIKMLNSDKRTAKRRFNETYKSYVNIIINEMNLKDNKEINQNASKIQEKCLEKMSKIYNFEVIKRKI